MATTQQEIFKRRAEAAANPPRNILSVLFDMRDLVAQMAKLNEEARGMFRDVRAEQNAKEFQEILLATPEKQHAAPGQPYRVGSKIRFEPTPKKPSEPSVPSSKRRLRGARASARPAKAAGVSAKQKTARQLQGKYMGAVRGLSNAQKATVKKMKAGKGTEAAISYANSLKK